MDLIVSIDCEYIYIYIFRAAVLSKLSIASYVYIFFLHCALSQYPTSFVYLFCCPFALFCFSLSIDMSSLGVGIYRENIGVLGVESDEVNLINAVTS